jgi:hypothetical protein
MPIYYDSEGYPHFDINTSPHEEFGFIHSNYQNPIFIINITKAFKLLLATGMTPEECGDYFFTRDNASCRLDRG